MQKKIVDVQMKKGITNYRIYKALNLNPGNVNAFLKNADTSKVGLDTVRNILVFVNNYVAILRRKDQLFSPFTLSIEKVMRIADKLY